MKKYLIGFSYHQSEDLELWNAGIMEDFESSTGIFINAETQIEALEWAKKIAREFHAQENPKNPNTWDSFSHHCWIEERPEKSGWQHCLTFFQKVNVGQMPDLKKMTTKAYLEWEGKNNNEVKSNLNTPSSNQLL